MLHGTNLSKKNSALTLSKSRNKRGELIMKKSHRCIMTFPLKYEFDRCATCSLCLVYLNSNEHLKLVWDPIYDETDSYFHYPVSGFCVLGVFVAKYV